MAYLSIKCSNHFGSLVFSDLLAWQQNLKLYTSKHYMFRHPALITCFKQLQSAKILGQLSLSSRLGESESFPKQARWNKWTNWKQLSSEIVFKTAPPQGFAPSCSHIRNLATGHQLGEFAVLSKTSPPHTGSRWLKSDTWIWNKMTRCTTR